LYKAGEGIVFGQRCKIEVEHFDGEIKSKSAEIFAVWSNLKAVTMYFEILQRGKLMKI
jgi:hypothetical protein